MDIPVGIKEELKLQDSHKKLLEQLKKKDTARAKIYLQSLVAQLSDKQGSGK